MKKLEVAIRAYQKHSRACRKRPYCSECTELLNDAHSEFNGLLQKKFRSKARKAAHI